ncbi:hypothetical protein [Streptomyces sp. NPDC001292]
MNHRTEGPVADHPARSSHPSVTAGPHAWQSHTPTSDEGEVRP